MVEWQEEVRRRLTELRLAPTRESAIVEELALHLEDRYEELLASGIPPEEASRAVLAELKDVKPLIRELRSRWRRVAPEPVVIGTNRRGKVIADLWQDLRYGIRVLLKAPGFTVIAVFALALGIGANTAIFSVTDKLLIRSLAVKEPGALVLINSVSVRPYFVNSSFSYPEFSDYRARNQVFSGLLAFSRKQLELRTSERTERVSSEFVSSNYFAVLGVSAARGRTFSPAEDKTPGTQPVVVVSDGFWRKRFGATRDPIGQTVTLNGIPLTIVGIAPASFNGMMIEQPTEIWIPVLMHPQLAQSKFIYNRDDGWLHLIGRLKPGVNQTQAESGLDLLAGQIHSTNTPQATITSGLPFGEQHIKFEPGGKGISLLRKRFSSSLKLLMATPIPAGTAWIRVHLLSTGTPFGNDGGYFDALSLRFASSTATTKLTGTITDDGLYCGFFVQSWQKISGPGNVGFSDPAFAVTNVSFDAPGTYVLRLTADDFDLTAGSEVTVTVNAAATNLAPVVSAGANQTITLPTNSVTLSGSVTDDGLPEDDF